MKKFDFIIIGFGKAGKTFAKEASRRGSKVALIEKSKEMYGGTCINIGCIPTKVLVEDSKKGINFEEAIKRKFDVVEILNEKNYLNLANDPNIEVIDGIGRFRENKVIEVYNNEHIVDTLTAEKIIINTGAEPILPKINGIKKSKNVHDSTSILNLKVRPKNLVIIGGGYISLEFASIFTNFGTNVTVIERSDNLLPREDREIVAQVKNDLENRGVKFIFNATVKEVYDEENIAVVITNKGNFKAEAALIAIGRKPNTKLLDLENTDIKLGKNGEILVNEGLETHAKGVYAVGDVKGGLQFTYISLDDYRILVSQIFEKKNKNIKNRINVPYSVFITPVLSRVGMIASEAKEKGYEIKENKLLISSIPRHKIDKDTRGLFKVVVDIKTDQILGATLYGNKSEELINYIKIAMDNNIPYTYLRDNIYTHPTVTEGFNDLFNF